MEPEIIFLIVAAIIISVLILGYLIYLIIFYEPSGEYTVNQEGRWVPVLERKKKKTKKTIRNF